MKKIVAVLAPLLVAASMQFAGAAPATPTTPTTEVLSYHASPSREGNFVIPGLSWDRARAIHPAEGFQADITGDINAQPLFWRTAGGEGRLLIATENNTVYEIDAATGKTLWQKSLGVPVPKADLPCGNIDPVGITGTPAIDAAKTTAYLNAEMKGADGAPEHAIFALSLADGAVLKGWPVNVAAALKGKSDVPFDARIHGERGAVVVMGGKVFVPYGGNFGDCEAYRGWVVGVDRKDAGRVSVWHTGAVGGAVWSPGGISHDDKALFVATGNTMDHSEGRKYAAPKEWGDGEAVIRLPSSLKFKDDPAFYFAPSDWKEMDDKDQDLGGIAPMLFDLSGQRLALALGKDGKAYLLNRDRPGGFGGQLAVAHVSQGAIRGSGAVFPVGDAEYAAFQGKGSDCPTGGNGLTVIKIAAAPAAITTAWCADMAGRGSPIATTTDGQGNPIVWIAGAQGNNKLYAFRGDTGEKLFESEPLPGLQHFQTLIATPDRLYIAGQDALYAFAF